MNEIKFAADKEAYEAIRLPGPMVSTLLALASGGM